MYLVDEQHVAILESGEYGGDIAGALDGGPGRGAHVDPHLGGDDVGQRGLAQAGRPVQQHVVQRLAPALRRVDGDLEVVLYLLLSQELREAFGAQGGIEGSVFLLGLARHDAFHVVR